MAVSLEKKEITFIKNDSLKKPCQNNINLPD